MSTPAVPTLADLVEDPNRAEELPPETLPVVQCRLAAAMAAVAARMAYPAIPSTREQLLTVQEASVVLRLSEDHLYRNADRYPFTVRPSAGTLRFSREGINRYIRNREGR